MAEQDRPTNESYLVVSKESLLSSQLAQNSDGESRIPSFQQVVEDNKQNSPD